MESNDHLDQNELNALLGMLDFVEKDPFNFSIEGWIHPAGFPSILVKGKVVGTYASSLLENVSKKLEEPPGHLIVDLTQCQFLSSIALGFLAVVASQRLETGHNVFLVAPNTMVKNIIRLMGFEQVFVRCDTLEEALARAKGEISKQQDWPA